MGPVIGALDDITCAVAPPREPQRSSETAHTAAAAATTAVPPITRLRFIRRILGGFGVRGRSESGYRQSRRAAVGFWIRVSFARVLSYRSLAAQALECARSLSTRVRLFAGPAWPEDPHASYMHDKQAVLCLTGSILTTTKIWERILQMRYFLMDCLTLAGTVPDAIRVTRARTVQCLGAHSARDSSR